VMSEVHDGSGEGNLPKRGDHGLMDRALAERWAIPEAERCSLVQRLGEIVRDPTTAHRDVLAAASALLAASKINLANIATTLDVQARVELEQRVTELEVRAAASAARKSR
jgi:hypothetical protein